MSHNLVKSAVASAVFIALTSAAHADESNTNQQQIEEVSVIAKKLTYANNTVDANMLEQQAPITSVLSLMDNLPGISINEGDAFGGDDWSTSITMRGFSIDGNQQQLGMTIDGIPNGGSNYGGGAKANRYLTSENVETIEVSQGTSDISSASLEALGGTFNFVSRAPAREQATTIAYTTGDHDAQRYFARHETGEILDNTYAYISYSDTSTSRWVGEGANGGMLNQHIEAKIVSEFEKLTITGRISYDDVEEDNYNSVSIEQFNQTPDWDQLTWNWTGIPHLDQMFAEGWSTLRENTLAYLKFEYAISDTTTFEISPYYHKNKGRGDWIPPYLQYPVDSEQNPTSQGGSSAFSYGFTDQAGTPLAPAEGCESNYTWPWNSGAGLHPSCYPDDAVPVMSYRHTHYQKQRTGFTADFETTIGNHDITAGVWFEQAQRDEHRDWHKVIDARIYHHFDSTPYWTQYDNTFDTDTFKWYLQDTITMNDFTLNLGVQKFLVDVEKTDHFDSINNAKINSDSDVLFSVGALYQFNETTEFFAGYSENFSAIKDGVLERDSSTLTEIEAETAENIDFGFRYFGQNLTLSTTFYTIEFSDRITFIAPGSNTGGIDYGIGTNGSYINVGGIESQGVEISATYKLSDNWELYSSLTKNDSEYTETIEFENIKAGDSVRDSIEDMFVVSANYYSGDLRFGLSAKYTGERIGRDLTPDDNINNRVDPEDYIIADMNLGYHMDFENSSLDIAFVVNNLFDKDYLSSGIGNGSAFYIGAPRTATLTMQLDF